MKMQGKPPEKGVKGEGSARRKAPLTERADNTSPMDNFKALAGGVLKVPRDDVVKEERAEKRKKRD